MTRSVCRPAAIVVAAALLLCTGCATIFRGGRQQVMFSSTPDRAEVIDGGLTLGETPVTAALRVDRSHSIEFRKSGYKSRNLLLSRHVSGLWLVLDLILGAPGLWIPLMVDFATGNIYDLDETHVNVTLEPEQQ